MAVGLAAGPFDPVSGQHGTGHHELWLTTGSRAGDQGLWELDVEEGVAGVEPTGEPPVFDALGAAKTPTPATRTRGWKTALRPVTSTTTSADERFVAAREDRNLRRRALAFERQCQRTFELLTAYPDGRTARFIRDTLGMSGDRIKRVLDSLIEKGHVVRMEDRLIDARRPIVTYARVQVMDLSGRRSKRAASPGLIKKCTTSGRDSLWAGAMPLHLVRPHPGRWDACRRGWVDLPESGPDPSVGTGTGTACRK